MAVAVDPDFPSSSGSVIRKRTCRLYSTGQVVLALV